MRYSAMPLIAPLVDRVILPGDDAVTRHRKVMLIVLTLMIISSAIIQGCIRRPGVGLILFSNIVCLVSTIFCLAYLLVFRSCTARTYGLYVAALGVGFVLHSIWSASTLTGVNAFWSIILMNIALLGHLPCRFYIIMAALDCAWVVVIYTEKYLRFGLLDIWGTMPYDDRRAVCECERPPCMERDTTHQPLMDMAMIITLVITIAWMNRKSLHSSQLRADTAAQTVDAAQRVLRALSSFDLSTATAELAAAQSTMPDELYQPLLDILANLKSYRPFIPDALFLTSYNGRGHGRRGLPPRRRWLKDKDGKPREEGVNLHTVDISDTGRTHKLLQGRALSDDSGSDGEGACQSGGGGGGEVSRPTSASPPGISDGHAAVLFTDIRHSTALWLHSSEAMKQALTRHNAIIRGAISRRNAYEVKTIGDAFMVAFDSAVEAVEFAADVQERLHAEKWPANLHRGVEDGYGPLCVRIGVHVGEVHIEENVLTGRRDYFGPTVNRAAQAETLGAPGAITVTQEVMTECERETLIEQFIVVPYPDAVRTAVDEMVLTALLPRSLESAWTSVLKHCVPGALEAPPPPPVGSAQSRRATPPCGVSPAALRELVEERFQHRPASQPQAQAQTQPVPVPPMPQIAYAGGGVAQVGGLPMHPNAHLSAVSAEAHRSMDSAMAVVAQRRSPQSADACSSGLGVRQWSPAADMMRGDQVAGSVCVVKCGLWDEVCVGPALERAHDGLCARLNVLDRILRETGGVMATAFSSTAVLTWNVHSRCVQHIQRSVQFIITFYKTLRQGRPNTTATTTADLTSPMTQKTRRLSDRWFAASGVPFYAGIASGLVPGGVLTLSSKRSFMMPLGPSVDFAMMLCAAAAELDTTLLVGSSSERRMDRHKADPFLSPFLRPVDRWLMHRPPKGADAASLRGITHVSVLEANMPGLVRAEENAPVDLDVTPPAAVVGGGVTWSDEYLRAFYRNDVDMLRTWASEDPVVAKVCHMVETGTHLQHAFMVVRGATVADGSRAGSTRGGQVLTAGMTITELSSTIFELDGTESVCGSDVGCLSQLFPPMASKDTFAAESTSSIGTTTIEALTPETDMRGLAPGQVPP